MSLKMFSTESVKSTIAIAAGKGGVGKSSITTNLALSLKNMGLKVGILDADIYGPSIRKMLPEDTLPKQTADDLEPVISFGIPTISMAYFKQEGVASAIRAPIANNIILQFLKKVQWGALDYLLIDFPPGTGDIQLTLCQNASISSALMLTTPQEISTIDVRKAADLFKKFNIPILGIVENMSYYLDPLTMEKIAIFGQGGGKMLASTLHSPLLAQIPLDPNVCACADQGKSLIHSFTQSTSAQEFMLLAERVHGYSQLQSSTPHGTRQELEKQMDFK